MVAQPAMPRSKIEYKVLQNESVIIVMLCFFILFFDTCSKFILPYVHTDFL